MTSSVPEPPLRRRAAAARLDEAATDFFDEHVVADAVHENIAAVDLAGGLARAGARAGADVLWGAARCVELEARWAAHLLGAWGGEGAARAAAEPRSRPARA